METVKVTASKEYTVHIGTGYLDTIGEKIKEIKRLCRVVLISDDTVFSLYGEKVKKSLADSGYSVVEFVFPHGEISKTAATVVSLWEALAKANLTRTDFIAALGGGIVATASGCCSSQVPSSKTQTLASVVIGLPAVVITHDTKQAADFSGADKNTALQENPVETTFPSSK